MKKAFTIVELLVVMAVIGILITLAVVGIQALQKAQRETTRLNDLRGVQSTLESYYSKYRSYPAATANNTVVGATFEVGYVPATGVITFYDNATDAATTFTTTLQQKGLEAVSATANQGGIRVHTTSFDLISTCVPGSAANNANADAWQIYYKTAATNPQSYALAACTENGLSANLGTKID